MDQTSQINLNDFGLRQLAVLAEETSHDITRYVTTAVKYRQDNRDMISGQTVEQVTLRIESGLRDEWFQSEMYVDGLDLKALGTTKAAELRARNVPTNEGLRKMRIAAAMAASQEYQDALIHQSDAVVEAATRDEEVMQARRLHQHMMFAWRQNQILALSVVHDTDALLDVFGHIEES
jgi:hypothetical protein